MKTPFLKTVLHRTSRIGLAAVMLAGVSSGVLALSAAPSSAAEDVLTAGSILDSGQYLVSGNDEYELLVGGNLTEYLLGGKGAGTVPSAAVWDSSATTTGKYLELDSNGNLELWTTFGSNKIVVWSAGVAAGTKSFLEMEDNGNLVLYTSASKAVWASYPLTTGQAIATLAEDNFTTSNGALTGTPTKAYCSTNSLGGSGFHPVQDPSNDPQDQSCNTDGPGTAQLWCGDFAAWVWDNAVSWDDSGRYLESGPLYSDPAYAPHFWLYGYNTGRYHSTGTPSAGDAIVFGTVAGAVGTSDYDAIQHVAIVVGVSGSTVTSIGGDEANPWVSATTSRVERDTYTYGIGKPAVGWYIEGYIVPELG
jgi:hypothetical protein